jgi:two-component system chemotaxis response regulator CheB
VNILVVDDSIVFRSAIVTAIKSENGLEVVRSLMNGKLAVDYVLQNPNVNLITLDMEMPVMDGIETIKEIRKFNKKVVIIVFSSLTQKGAEKTFEALNAGANDFVTKPENVGSNADQSIISIKEELIPKILAFREKKYVASEPSKNEIRSTNILNFDLKQRPNLVLIGCSTGGPEALGTLFKNIKNNLTVPILIVQHMPPMFTEKLAEMLSKLSTLKVSEAHDGDKLLPGVCYVAPGDFHMTIGPDNIVHLDKNEKVCFVRPSVDVLFNSVAANFRGNILAFVLTGMGEDGAVGAKKLFDKGANIFIQDKESSIVWGMPGSVKKVIDSVKAVNLEDAGRLIDNNCK